MNALGLELSINGNEGRSPQKEEQVMQDKRIYIERRPEGDYAVRRADSKRASGVEPTQKDAIGRAKEIEPDSRPHVERVRTTEVGKPDQWRKA